MCAEPRVDTPEILGVSDIWTVVGERNGHPRDIGGTPRGRMCVSWFLEHPRDMGGWLDAISVRDGLNGSPSVI